MIYLDHNANHPVLPEVMDAMSPWLGVPCNPSSTHQFGQRARNALEEARERIAHCLKRPKEGVVFTSGASEANHAYFVDAWGRGIRRIAISPFEHPCIFGAAGWFSDQGGQVTVLKHEAGVLQHEPADAYSVMAANHETGQLFEPMALAAGAEVHMDATQAIGKTDHDWSAAYALSMSAHKLGGPVGIGAICWLDGEPRTAFVTGGGQERGRRAGTTNVASAVGFAKALSIAFDEKQARTERHLKLQSRLEDGIRRLGGRVVADHLPRLCNTSCVVFEGVMGEGLVVGLDLAAIAVSHGAACASGSLQHSPVLTALGDEHPGGALRISLGRATSEADIDQLLRALPDVLQAQRLAAELTLHL